MTGSVGIFWGIPAPDHSWTILADTTSLAEAEHTAISLPIREGTMRYRADGRRCARLPSPTDPIRQVISDPEYEFFPRGRIVYSIGTGGFILYADRRLQQDATIARIAEEFGLAIGTYVVRSDAHYRS